RPAGRAPGGRRRSVGCPVPRPGAVPARRRPRRRPGGGRRRREQVIALASLLEVAPEHASNSPRGPQLDTAELVLQAFELGLIDRAEARSMLGLGEAGIRDQPEPVTTARLAGAP